MDLQHVNIKIHVDGDLGVDPESFITVFHDWVREHSLPGLLIDVADYRHVPNGPGVMLIGHEHDFSMDHLGGTWGLLYNRKKPLAGSNSERLIAALGNAANACNKLEILYSGALRFSRQVLDVIINDRAVAPNTTETFAACTPEIEGILATALGTDVTLTSHGDDPRRRYGVSVTCSQPYDLAAVSAACPPSA